MSRSRKLLASTFAVLALLAAAAPAMGSQPPGQLGYEGQPGNQGGPNHHP
jgi:Spy/CpxP family protein refolding chaperone